MTRLCPGDRVSFLSPKGRKLRGTVVESMELRARKTELLVPVVRTFNRRRQTCQAEIPVQPRVRWIERSKLRKLPVKPTP